MPNEIAPIPPGFHSLTMHLVVNGAAAYLDFLKRAFHAKEMHCSPGPGGTIMHATVRIGDSNLMFADPFPGQPAPVSGNLPVTINYYVENADAAWAQAVAAGCEITMPLADQFWGDRYGHVRDPFGFTWAIAQAVELVSPEEAQARAKKVFGA